MDTIILLMWVGKAEIGSLGFPTNSQELRLYGPSDEILKTLSIHIENSRDADSSDPPMERGTYL